MVFSCPIFFCLNIKFFFNAMVPNLVSWQSQIFYSRIQIWTKMLFQNSCVRMPSRCRVKGCKSLTGLYKANSELQRTKWKEALSFTGKGNNKDKLSTETDKRTSDWDYIMTQKDTIHWFWMQSKNSDLASDLLNA